MPTALPIEFIDYALERFPFRVDVIQTDNGSEFQAAFHWHVLPVARPAPLRPP